jgi:hypothetical protein
MYLCHQGAGGVKYLELATLGLALYRFGNAMSAEDDVIIVGNLVEFLDKYCALLLEVIDDVAVMHDFMAHVDRRAKKL